MNNSNKRVKQEEVVLPRGQKKKHGGYSFVRSGKLPKDKAHVARYLTWLRETYIHDLAKSEEDLSAAQTILINKLIMLEGLCRCMEIRAVENESLAMPQMYLQYVTTITRICSLLGIEPREVVSEVSPTEQARVIQAEIAEKDEEKDG